ncbi:MAG: D-2-hydroxyacid dehydrogenase [Saccharofermentans sp.]|nr:D-2-hydroxyacid dehydrogenase [Saccharofermentans sp.]
MKIVILDASAANPGDLSWGELERFGEVIAYDFTEPGEVIPRLEGAEIAITNKTCFTREIIEALPCLRYIGVLATGYNVVDLKAATEKGIVVTNVPEYATFATAQMAIALLLEMSNNVGLHNASVGQGDWIRSKQFCYWVKPLTELCGKDIAVVGMGKIGRRVALIAETLGMNVLKVPHTIRNSDEYKLEDVLGRADVITLHCPLTEDTRDLIDASALSKCKDGVMVINCARGPVVNEEDMAKALKEGKVAGYGCDVISVEPMKADNPLMDAPNTYITPHIAWAPKETRARLITAAAGNIEAFLKGEPVNKVN